MKKIILQLAFIFFAFYTTAIFAQVREIERARVPIKIEEGDEYLGRKPIIGYPTAGKGGVTNCHCEFEDISFNFGHNFGTAIDNYFLVERVRKKKIERWYRRQNDLIKKHLESRFNKSFSSFNDARNHLFKTVENKSYSPAYKKLTDKYGGRVKASKAKTKKNISNFKLLKLRENEIKNGKINTSAYPNLIVNGKKLTSYKSLNSIKSSWNTEYNTFSKNHIGLQSNVGITQSPYYKKTTAENYILNQYVKYYNKYNPWDRLNLMIFLVNVENDNIRLNPPHGFPSQFSKYQDISIGNLAPLEAQVLRTKKKVHSVFDRNYWKVILKKKYGFNYSSATERYEKAACNDSRRIHAQEKEKVLSTLMNSTPINATFYVDKLVSKLNITNVNELEWLNNNTLKANKIERFLEAERIRFLQNLPNIYQSSLEIEKSRIKNGGMVQEMIKKVKPDYYTKKWLYDNESFATSLVKEWQSLNKPLDLKAYNYVKGQAELEKGITGIPWKASTGMIENNSNLKFTHVYHDFGKKISYYKLTDGSIIASSSYEKVLTSAGDLIDKDRSNIGGCQNCRFYYIKLSENDVWAEMLFNPNNLGDELKTLFALAGKDLGKNLGRYVLPVEDIKILIDGKDFDGQQVARWKAAGGILLTVVPGGKIVGTGAKVLRPVLKIADDVAEWVIVVAKANGKTTKLTFKVVRGVVTFGSRSNLAKIIGTKAGEEAHHIIPWADKIINNPIIQKAARAGFHMNAKINGIALKKYSKLIGEGLHGNHPAYNTFVDKKLKAFIDSTSDLTPEIANDFLENKLIPELLNKIGKAKKSGLNLNDYFKTLL
ncbi:AHH domain-containing protein [Tenacibaculum sp. Ill]|uniref:AHH domain-containing protein n=1 Tax=Tenacibaculum sp. Ill TaxID=3445935 RepID=UPI003F791DFA